MTANNHDHDSEAELLARAYRLILSWPDDPGALNQAADQAAKLAEAARVAAEHGDRKRAGRLRRQYDSLYDRIEKAAENRGQSG